MVLSSIRLVSMIYPVGQLEIICSRAREGNWWSTGKEMKHVKSNGFHIDDPTNITGLKRGDKY